MRLGHRRAAAVQSFSADACTANEVPSAQNGSQGVITTNLREAPVLSFIRRIWLLDDLGILFGTRSSKEIPRDTYR